MKMGAPGASLLGTWESIDLGLGKLKSFIAQGRLSTPCASLRSLR
jgi:hypothetical protein